MHLARLHLQSSICILQTWETARILFFVNKPYPLGRLMIQIWKNELVYLCCDLIHSAVNGIDSLNFRNKLPNSCIEPG